jgi:hypothetical protein
LSSIDIAININALHQRSSTNGSASSITTGHGLLVTSHRHRRFPGVVTKAVLVALSADRTFRCPALPFIPFINNKTSLRFTSLGGLHNIMNCTLITPSVFTIPALKAVPWTGQI